MCVHNSPICKQMLTNDETWAVETWQKAHQHTIFKCMATAQCQMRVYTHCHQFMSLERKHKHAQQKQHTDRGNGETINLNPTPLLVVAIFFLLSASCQTLWTPLSAQIFWWASFWCIKTASNSIQGYEKKNCCANYLIRAANKTEKKQCETITFTQVRNVYSKSLRMLQNILKNENLARIL